MKELLYLYCVTNSIPRLEEAKVLVDNLYWVNMRDLYAVVSKVSEGEFGEENLKKNLADLDWIKIKANVHEKVIEEIMKNTCVIPFKFGTIFNSEGSLRKCLEGHLRDLRINLLYLTGKEEWGVKIYCDMEKLKSSLINDGETSKIDQEISSSSPGKAFLMKKKKEELLNEAKIRKVNEYCQEIFNVLRGTSVEAKIGKLLPREVTERNDDMILNAAFLIAKNMVTKFVNAVEDLKAKHADQGLFFDQTGPWPSYNFCLPICRIENSEVKLQK